MKEWEKLSPEHRQIIEELADIEHKQWWSWTLALEPKMPKEVVARWKRNQIPYSELSEMDKDLDRRWAMVVYSVFEKGLPICRWCGHDPT